MFFFSSPYRLNRIEKKMGRHQFICNSIFFYFFVVVVVFGWQIDHQAVTGTTETCTNQPVPGRIERVDERRSGGWRWKSHEIRKGRRARTDRTSSASTASRGRTQPERFRRRCRRHFQPTAIRSSSGRSGRSTSIPGWVFGLRATSGFLRHENARARAWTGSEIVSSPGQMFAANLAGIDCTASSCARISRIATSAAAGRQFRSCLPIAHTSGRLSGVGRAGVFHHGPVSSVQAAGSAATVAHDARHDGRSRDRRQLRIVRRIDFARKQTKGFSRFPAHSQEALRAFQLRSGRLRTHGHRIGIGTRGRHVRRCGPPVWLLRGRKPNRSTLSSTSFVRRRQRFRFHVEALVKVSTIAIIPLKQQQHQQHLWSSSHVCRLSRQLFSFGFVY